ncbi:ATP-binding protein [Advenella incenata]
MNANISILFHNWPDYFQSSKTPSAVIENRKQLHANGIVMEHAGEILILTGPPGSGKTTAALALTEQAGSAKVHLHTDDFWRFIKNGAIAPYLPSAHIQNNVVMNALSGVAQSYAHGGYFVVVDGIIGPWFLPSFQTIATPVHYIVLRPSLALSIARCQQRGNDTLTDPEPIAALHQQFSLLGELEHHVLSIDDKTRQETLEMIISAMQTGKFRL